MDPIEPDQPTQRRPVRDPQPESVDELGPLRLLHVEDNPADAVLMQEYIREACQQWDISLSDNSVIALHPEPLTAEFDTAERLADLSPERVDAADCAILDLSLPDASGLEALVALRKMSEDLPIIVLTGFDDLETGLAALRSGADDYLIKSKVDGSSLDRAVRYAIARRQLTMELSAAAAADTIAAANVVLESLRDTPGVGAAGVAGLLASRSRGWGAAPGTHRVTVQIERATGDYALFCESCGWQVLRRPGELHAWTDRGLDALLLRHVESGDGSTPDAP